jgi:hypothetical protein
MVLHIDGCNDVLSNWGNGELHLVDAAPDTPLLYVLRNDAGLNGPKFGCGLRRCGESFMDELADAAGIDPSSFCLLHLRPSDSGCASSGC